MKASILEMIKIYFPLAAFCNFSLYEYLRTDDWRLNKVKVIRSTDKKKENAIAGFSHDSNGILNGKYGAADEILNGCEVPTVVMDTTPEGWLMNKQSLTGLGNKQTHYLHNSEGELLGGYTSDYQDTLRPILIQGFFHNDQNWLAAFERSGYIPYPNAILVCTNSAIFFVNKKLLRDSKGKIIVAKAPVPIQNKTLPVSARIGNTWDVIDRNSAPEQVDKTMNAALGLVNRTLADNLQRHHSAYHNQGIAHDVKPLISDIVPYSMVHPITQIKPPAQIVKNNPLGWDEPNVLQQLGLQTYIVRPGDTFLSIAKNLGDKDAADNIANINGFPTSSSAPKAGMILRIPQLIAARNKATSHRPDEDFLRIIAGSLSPAFKMAAIAPPRRHKKHHKNGFFGSLIKVIAITLVCVAAPHLADYFFVSGSISAMVATGVFAAIGDAAVQGVAIGMGVQEQFSFNEMLETAVTAGIGGSLKEVNSITSLALNTLKIASAAVGTQLIEMKTGLREKFDAAAIATQIAASVGSSLINKRDRCYPEKF